MLEDQGPCVCGGGHSQGLALMVRRPLGPAWAGGSGQSPAQASETLDFPSWEQGPHQSQSQRGEALR